MVFEVVFTGKLRDGFTRRQGIDTLCQKFSLNFEQVKRLLSAPGQVIKRSTKRQQAERVIQALWDGGWHTELLLDDQLIYSTSESWPYLRKQYSSDASISIWLPETWELCRDLNPRALFQAGDRNENHYIVILKQSREELPPDLTLSSYACAQLQQCIVKVSDGQLLSEPKEVACKEVSFYISQMSAQLGGNVIRYLVAHHQCESDNYAIFIWCEDLHFQRQEKLFNQIVSSFRREKDMNLKNENPSIDIVGTS